MKIPGGNVKMNWKTYAIFGAIVIVGAIVASKLMKYEVTTTTKDTAGNVTASATQILKPVLNIQKEK